MRVRLVLGALLALLPLGAGVAHAACTLGKIAELPVTLSRMEPILAAKFNGRDIRLMADSGAFYSLISRADAQALGLTMQAAPMNFYLEGVGGATDVEVTHVQTFTLAGVDIPDVEFLVGGTAFNAVGVLGRNILAMADTEYDLGEGAIRLFRPRGCGGGADLAYWAADKVVTIVPLQWSDGPTPPAIVGVKINGVEVRALMDTGAGTTVLSLPAARRAGIDVNAPGVSRAGVTMGIGRRPVRLWLAPISSFEIGGEKITNAKIEVIDDSGGRDHDMLLGADFFLSHRVLISKALGKVFITYQGGPVFDLGQHPQMAPENQALADIAEPIDAAGYSRRGAAYLERGDTDRAMGDLDKAVAMTPKEPRYHLQRAQARIAKGQLFLAMGDLDAAVTLDPDDLDALIVRAELRRAGHDDAGAEQDLAATIKAASPEANLRLAIADQEMALGRYDAAIEQYDLWVRYHPEDAKLGRAYEGLCFSQAMTGRDLDRAVSQCNRAVGLGANSVRPLAARGLVRVRRGEFARAIADDNAALKLTTKAPWALWGRGLAEEKTGEGEAGKADLDAAAKLYPSIGEQATQVGLGPDAAIAPRP